MHYKCLNEIHVFDGVDLERKIIDGADFTKQNKNMQRAAELEYLFDARNLGRATQYYDDLFSIKSRMEQLCSRLNKFKVFCSVFLLLSFF